MNIRQGFLAFVLATAIAFVSIASGAYYSFRVAPDDAQMTPEILGKSFILMGMIHCILIGILIVTCLMGKRVRERELLVFLMTPLALCFFHSLLGVWYEPAVWFTAWITSWRILVIRQNQGESHATPA